MNNDARTVSGGRPGPLARRLALAFLAVALGALAVLTVVTLLSARGGFTELTEQQQQATLQRTAALAAAAYEQAGGWDGAGLHAAVAVGAFEGAEVTVRDLEGRSVPIGPMAPMPDMPGMGGGDLQSMMRRMHGPPGETGPPAEEVIDVDGTPVGSVELRFPVDDAARAELQLRDALTRNVLVAASVAAGLALVAAWVVAGRLTRPLTRLTHTVEAVAAGDHSVRSRAHGAPGDLGTLAVAVDCMADTLERQEELRRALLADVTHELRTPLAIALGECDAILDGIVEPEPERLASVREEIVRLSRLVGDLESLAAAESASLRLELEPLDLGDVVEDVLALHGPRLLEHGLDLHVEVAPAPIRGDHLRLGQIVANLVINAGKFSPPGGRIDVEVATIGERVSCVVTDDGPGIPDDELPHVFERFWQGRAAAATGGSGIGLAVAAELARVHGGDVEATNAPGRGARLTFWLPAA